jgi:hypothetical protein
LDSSGPGLGRTLAQGYIGPGQVSSTHSNMGERKHVGKGEALWVMADSERERCDRQFIFFFLCDRSGAVRVSVLARAEIRLTARLVGAIDWTVRGWQAAEPNHRPRVSPKKLSLKRFLG